MTVRLVGGGILLIWAAFIGRHLSKFCSRRCASLDRSISLVEYIRRNIQAFRRPVSDIMESCCDEEEGLEGLCDLIRNGGCEDGLVTELPELPEDAFELLQKFSRELGTDYTDGEVKRCEYYIAALKDIRDREKEKLEKNERLYRFLPPLGVLSVIIVML